MDSSVLLDVLGADPEFGEPSRKALRRSYDEGALIACDVVWAEVRAHFTSDELFGERLAVLGVRFDPLEPKTAATAGRLWRQCRAASTPEGRRRIVADFLIGAHGFLQADRLLSRDRGFYRQYFHALTLVDPGAG